MGSADVMETWHRILREKDFDALEDLLADDVVFHSPIVHTPQEGKAVTLLYLKAAFGVLGGDTDGAEGKGELGDGSGSFHYVRKLVSDHDAVLEFRTTIDGIVVNGIDMIRWNDDGQIVDFKVMVRPLKAIQKVHGLMAAMLERTKSA